MAVAFDAVGPSSSGSVKTTSSTSSTWSHTVGTGTNRYLVVGVSLGGGSTGTGTCTATFGGVSMTQLGTARPATTGTGKVYLFGLANPASGTGTVTITSSTAGVITGGSTSWTGVGSVGTAASAVGGSVTAAVSVTGTATSSMVVAQAGAGSAFSATTQTLRYRATGNTASSAGNSQGISAAGNGGTVAMSNTLSSDDWAVIAVELKAATVAYTGSAVTTSATTPLGSSTLTVSITPAVGELLVVKTGTGDFKVTATSVSDSQGLTWTIRNGAGAASTATAYIWTAVAAAAVSHTITVNYTSTSSGSTNYPRAICVERYANAVPNVTDTVTGSGTSSDSIITQGATGSVVTFIDSDWNGVTTGTPTYLSSATATGAAYRPSTGCFYFAQQATTGAGSVSYGMSAPTGQKATLVALELAVAGSIGGTNYSAGATLSATSGMNATATGGKGVPVWAAVLDGTYTTNVQAGFEDDSWNRETAAGNDASSGIAWPINLVTAPGGHPGQAIPYALPSASKRYESVAATSYFNDGDGPFYFGMSFYLDSSFPVSGGGDYQVITQLRQDDSTGSPGMSLEVRSGTLRATGGYGVLGASPASQYAYDIQLATGITTATWYNVVWSMNFSATAGGSVLNVWLNGTQVLTSYTVPPPTVIGAGTYWKSGLYHDPASAPAATIYQAGLALGRSYDSVDPTTFTAYLGQATLSAVSSTSFSGPAETARAAATLAGTSGTTATAQAAEKANAALSATSGTTAAAVLGALAALSTGSTSGVTAGGVAGVSITLSATSGTTATAGATERAQAAITGASGTTAQPQIAAQAAATLSSSSGMFAGPFATERGAATLSATSGTTVTFYAVRLAAVATSSASGTTVNAPRVVAVAAATLSATSGTTVNANPPDAPAAAVLAAVSGFSPSGLVKGLAGGTLTAFSAIYADAGGATPPFVPPPGPVRTQVRNPRWRLLVFDTVTGRIGYELPYTALSWSSKLNDAGQMTATIPIESALTTIAKTGADDPMVLFREFLTGPYRYSVAVAYGNVIVWAGPYLPSKAAADKPEVDIAGIEFAKLLDKRLMLNPAGIGALTDTSYDLSFTGTTLPAIAYMVVMVAISGLGKQLPVTCSDVPDGSNGLESAAWNGYDLTTCWKALADISARDGGPDVRFDPYLYQGTDGDYVAYELRIGEPYIPGGPGGIGPDGPLPWTWDETTALIQPDSDAAGMASSYFVPGSGQDREKLIGTATRSTLLTYGFPVLEVVDGQHSSETDEAVLDSFALADVYAGSRPAISWSVSVPVEGDQAFGQYHPGDMARLDVDRNLLIPPDTYMRRITELSGDGGERVSLSVMNDVVPSAAELIDDTETISIPQNLTASLPGGGAILLDWDDVYGASGYRVYETRSPEGVAAVTTSQSLRGPFNDQDRTFTYWVTSLVNGIESLPSPTVSVVFGLG